MSASRLLATVIVSMLMLFVQSAAFASCDRHYGDAAPPTIERNDLRITMRYCLNRSGETPENRQFAACNALIRYACTPSSGFQLRSTEDRQVLAWAYTMRASAFINNGQTAEGLADLDDAVAAQPTSALALTNRCRTRAAANIEIAKALADCEAALAADAGFVAAYDSRGLALLRNGAFDAAIAAFDEALRRDHRLSSAQYGRGVARAKLGQREAAQADLDAAMQRDEGVDDWYAALGLAP